MTADENLNACAETVRSGDPDRFLATMAAPSSLRGSLFAIYALNVEISRAPWVSTEPMLCEMRLQWWRDELGQIAAGKKPAPHNILTPLSRVIDSASAQVLITLTEARKWDIHHAPFADSEHLASYLEDTAAGLMWVAAHATGVTSGEAAIRDFGYGAGLANWFRAVPDLKARGRIPLPDHSEGVIAELAQAGLERLSKGRKAMPKNARYAAYTGWQAHRTLRSVAANPATVAGGRLHNSEFSRRTSLLWHVYTGRP